MTDNLLDFKTIFEALPGTFLLLLPDAPQYTIVAANDDGLRITDLQRQEVVGKSIFEVYPENPGEPTATGPSHIRTSLDTVLKTKKENRLPVVRYDVLNAEGVFDARYWSPLHKPILNGKGEVAYIIHAPTEVTEQVKAEKKQQELRKIERTYDLFMQAPVAVFIVSGPEHIVELANEEFLKLLGGTSDIVGKPLFEAVPGAAAQGFPELLNQVRKTGQPYEATEYLTRLVIDGKEEVRYYNFVYQPYYANPADKMPSGVISSGHNVTEQVLARQRIEQSEYLFRNLIVESPVPTSLLTGPEFTIEVANEPMIQIMGKGNSIIGKPLGDVLPEVKSEGQPFLQILETVFTSGKAYEEKAAKAIVVRNGVQGTYFFDYTYKPLFNAHGDVYAIINTVVDVTDKVIAEKQLEEEKAYLQNAIDIGELGTFKIDIASNTILYSEAFKHWFGVPDLKQSVEELVSKIHPDDRQMVVDVVSTSTGATEDIRHDIIYRVISADGKTKHLRSIGKTIFLDGQLKSVNGLIQEVSLQVNAQLRLQESESRFRSMIHQAPVAIGLTRGREGVYEIVNAPMLRLIGKSSEEELLGKKITTVFPELAGQAVLDTITRVYDTGEPFEGTEVPVQLNRNGGLELHYYNLAYTPMVESGKTTGVLHVAVDVTEQVEARRKLEANEQFIRSIVENAPYPIAVFVGQEMKIQFANQSTKNIWNKGNEVEGKLYTELVPELKGQKIFAQIREVFATGKPYHAKNQRVELFVNGEPQLYYFNYNCTPLFDAAGKVYGVMNSGVDITDLSQARQAMEESEARFRKMVQQAPMAILLMRSPELFIEIINAPMLQIMNKDESVIGKRVLDVLPELKVHPFLNDIHKIFETGKTLKGMEVPATINIEGSPKQRYFNVSYTPIVEEGEVTAILQVATDVTEQVLSRKHLEENQEELKLKNAELIIINNDLDNFIYTASHDLKSPILNIEALLQALLGTLPKESLDSEGQYITYLMQDSINRFKKTIANLTEVVKLQKENSGEAVSVNLPEVIAEVLLDLQPLILSFGTEVEINVEACPRIHFSEKNLRSVIYNLLSNGIKYRSPDRPPKIDITCHPWQQFHVLTVSDNGLGLDQSQVNNLFSMFRRFHDHVEGTGIGLYMVKKMIENVGGQIEVESREGEGTTFRVYFPA